MTLICTIRSGVTVKFTGAGVAMDEGFYELPVHVRMSEAAETGDPQGFIMKEIARHLAGCVQDTGLPLKEGLWSVQFTNFAKDNFNFPEGFTA
jgi:hypothetical protein